MELLKNHRDTLGFLVDPIDRANGDSTFYTSWFYFGLIVHNHHGNDFFQKNYFKDPMGGVEYFLRNFYSRCCLRNRLLRHPNVDQKNVNGFSLDQLYPLMMLLAGVKRYAPDLEPLAFKIVKHIVKLSEKDGRVSRFHAGKLNPSTHYVLGQLAKYYNIPYSKMNFFSSYAKSIQFYQWQWQNQSKMETAAKLSSIFSSKEKTKDHLLPRPYTIFNSVAELTTLAVINGKTKEIENCRKFYKYYARNNWGVFYKIISGLNYSTEEFKPYRTAKKDYMDIFSQRGKNHFKEERAKGVLCLDFTILWTMRAIWG